MIRRVGIIGTGWVGSSVAISLPAVVGSEGASLVVEPALDPEEREGLERSANVLQQAHEEIGSS